MYCGGAVLRARRMGDVMLKCYICVNILMYYFDEFIECKYFTLSTVDTYLSICRILILFYFAALEMQ